MKSSRVRKIYRRKQPVASVGKKPCVFCKEPISIGARFCVHCKRYQNRIRYIVSVCKIIGASVILSSFVSVALDIKKLLPSEAELVIAQKNCETESVKTTVVNLGAKPAALGNANLIISSKPATNGKYTLAPSVTIVGSQATAVVELKWLVQGQRHDLPEQVRGMKSCEYNIEFSYFNSNGSEKLINFNCDCPK